MKVVILSGGFGTRLQEETVLKPKPMVEIGGRPIVWHIMHIYAAYGYKEFILALGYKGEVVKNYFLNYRALSSDISVNLNSGKVIVHEQENEGWLIHLVDTGLRTETGGRLKRLAHYLQGETFMMTYGDGVANIDIRQLVDFHRSHGKLVTVTAVRPPARFGSLDFNGSLVSRFAEKPQTGEGWINGGFFVIEPQVLDYIEGDQTPWEGPPLEFLVHERQVMAYQHDGFWQGMDTMRDMRLLESLWAEAKAPWKVWD
jgi:glucose-1-phosphate cytidylyltransferase